MEAFFGKEKGVPQSSIDHVDLTHSDEDAPSLRDGPASPAVRAPIDSKEDR